ncbi:MAG: 4-(cytidine 5'-diphospho)-2-C-methyl-D-erythritol kinase, partial [Candidatus Margulisbacteria bacterium]|nr:4-(cytidine 5'-diphospho)-2-C-methyl-D-erythritol kinase [Candidatus Margulisiibacteriota bacterium]
MKLKAYAKINLSLRVFDKRQDGYHDLESVMQSVSLCDYITLTLKDSGIEVVCNDPKVPLGKDNIAYRAAEAFLKAVSSKQKAPQQSSGQAVSGCRIHIEKNIPMAAGLAGGSADAAVVLWGLNAEFRMPNDELMKVASGVGSDVPFCLTGGTCLVKGRGEIVEKQEPWPKTY